MLRLRSRFRLACIVAVALGSIAQAQGEGVPTAADRPNHEHSAQQHEAPPPQEVDSSALPEGMTLDEVLEYAESPPPEGYSAPVSDDAIYAFTLFEQLEYRVQEGGSNPLGWEAQGWVGHDFDKFWWKSEGEAVFEGRDEGESETDLLYSRLVSPFWNFQVGARYANEWSTDGYGDTWSGVVAMQGLAPYKFELDNSLFISEHGDVSFELEAEYNIRITQRLALQQRTELALYAQDIPERNIGAGLSDVSLDLRLRYEIKREFAPYIGIRSRILVGETDNLAESAGADTVQTFFLAGVRLAF